VKVYKITESPSWPDLLADSPLKIGVNTLADLMKKGRIRCRLHELPVYYAEMNWQELTRLAALHRELSDYLAELALEWGTKRTGEKRGGRRRGKRVRG
jgi:hypothetical protein